MKLSIYPIEMPEGNGTPKQFSRIKEVYDSVYNAMLTLAGKNEDTFPWEPNQIKFCTSMLIDSMIANDMVDKIYFPTSLNNEDWVEDVYYAKMVPADMQVSDVEGVE